MQDGHGSDRGAGAAPAVAAASAGAAEHALAIARGEPSPASEGKAPRTARGERTLRKILDAALGEFGEKGFGDSSIVGITTRAKVALGTFYTYFDSKEAVFAALVRDMSSRVRAHVAPTLGGARDAFDVERLALEAYLGFVADHKEVYRIIDEAEFVDPEGFRAHYETTAQRIAGRLGGAAARGELRDDPAADEAREVWAWAIMGINVFLGLRFGVWKPGDAEAIAAIANRLVRHGLQRGG